jgi:DNA-binding GntR family transcriptional regulator
VAHPWIGARLVRADEAWIGARLVRADEAQLLGEPPRSALLTMQRTAFNDKGAPPAGCSSRPVGTVSPSHLPGPL